ncbi:hypothetical protein [Fibrobacter succinogenes]|uniref:hypothetical protein n=1 Tax=Fibrobacter succinogenes TaxID=833 RepID=UPI001567F15E|nr:hypothetical protein [Fibrobacter succinogenes]
MPFSKEYLKDYEEKIRQLPQEELYDILCLIRDDPFKADDSPERVKIVENRIRELDSNYINEQDKTPISLIPTEELNNRLEEEFQKKPHTKSTVIRCIGFISIVSGFLLLPAKNENGLSLGMPFISITLFCFAYAGLIDKRTSIRGGVIHKAAHPIAFWCIIITEIILALLGIEEIISKGF